MTDLSHSAETPVADYDGILRFRIAEDGRGVTVSLEGELDIVTLPDAVMALELAGTRGTPVIVDCDQLRLADAAALRFLEHARDRARSSGSDLTLVNAQGIVRRLLELTDSLPLAAGGGRPGEPVPMAPGRTAVLQAAVAAAVHLAGTPRGNLQLTDPAARKLLIAAQQGFGQPFLEFFGAMDD